MNYSIKFYFSQILPNKINFAMLLAVPEREGVRRKPDGRVSLPLGGEDVTK